MLLQIVKRRQRAMLLEPARCGTEERTTQPEAASDRPGLGVVGNANGHVDALADQADRMVIDIQLQAQLRIASEEVRQQRRDQLHCREVRAGDAQRAAGVGPLALAGDFIGDPRQPAGLKQHFFPRRRQGQPAGGTMDQPGASPVLHLLQIATDHRTRHPQRPRRGAETSQLADAQVYLSSNHPVHHAPSSARFMKLSISYFRNSIK